MCKYNVQYLIRRFILLLHLRGAEERAEESLLLITSGVVSMLLFFSMPE